MNEKTYLIVASSPLVPAETLQAVLEAAPSAIPNTPRKIVCDVLALLEKLSTQDNEECDLSGNPFHAMYIRDLTEEYKVENNATFISPRWMGEVLTGMGIKSRHRRNDGMVAMWTPKQLEILKSYFVK